MEKLTDTDELERKIADEVRNYDFVDSSLQIAKSILNLLIQAGYGDMKETRQQAFKETVAMLDRIVKKEGDGRITISYKVAGSNSGMWYLTEWFENLKRGKLS